MLAGNVMLQIGGANSTMNDLPAGCPILHDSRTCRDFVKGVKGLPHPGHFSSFGWMFLLHRFLWFCLSLYHRIFLPLQMTQTFLIKLRI